MLQSQRDRVHVSAVLSEADAISVLFPGLQERESKSVAIHGVKTLASDAELERSEHSNSGFKGSPETIRVRNGFKFRVRRTVTYCVSE